jgi:Protein of unknown function (DUF2971)
MSLYKYLHSERTDVLRDQRIRFSSPAVLNDPFELKPHLKTIATIEYAEARRKTVLAAIVKEEFALLPTLLREKFNEEELLEKIKSQSDAFAEMFSSASEFLAPYLQTSMGKRLEELLGILCLSESATNLLMWAHYAEAHKGFVLQFDNSSSFFDTRVSEEDELRQLRRVTYSSKRPSLVLSEVNDMSSFMTKSIDWQYEREWRMILPLDNASCVRQIGEDVIHLFDIPASSITSVILGCRMLDAKKREIQQILLKQPQYAHVECIQATIDQENYCLNF